MGGGRIVLRPAHFGHPALFHRTAFGVGRAGPRRYGGGGRPARRAAAGLPEYPHGHVRRPQGRAVAAAGLSGLSAAARRQRAGYLQCDPAVRLHGGGRRARCLLPGPAGLLHRPARPLERRLAPAAIPPYRRCGRTDRHGVGVFPAGDPALLRRGAGAHHGGVQRLAADAAHRAGRAYLCKNAGAAPGRILLQYGQPAEE